MTHLSRTGLVLGLAAVALATSGCAMMEGGSMSTASSPPTGAMAMGRPSGGFVRAGFEPFSLASCMKFEAVPFECEGAVQRGE